VRNRDRIDVSVVDIAHHLARHGVKPEIAAARRCDLVVIVACGHAGLRELLFGGVTRHMLRYSTVPILISY
jgi:nucleotide-binding universal stress UspA family protein